MAFSDLVSELRWCHILHILLVEAITVYPDSRWVLRPSLMVAKNIKEFEAVFKGHCFVYSISLYVLLFHLTLYSRYKTSLL